MNITIDRRMVYIALSFILISLSLNVSSASNEADTYCEILGGDYYKISKIENYKHCKKGDWIEFYRSGDEIIDAVCMPAPDGPMVKYSDKRFGCKYVGPICSDFSNISNCKNGDWMRVNKLTNLILWCDLNRPMSQKLEYCYYRGSVMPKRKEQP